MGVEEGQAKGWKRADAEPAFQRKRLFTVLPFIVLPLIVLPLIVSATNPRKYRDLANGVSPAKNPPQPSRAQLLNRGFQDLFQPNYGTHLFPRCWWGFMQ